MILFTFIFFIKCRREPNPLKEIEAYYKSNLETEPQNIIPLSNLDNAPFQNVLPRYLLSVALGISRILQNNPSTFTITITDM